MMHSMGLSVDVGIFLMKPIFIVTIVILILIFTMISEHRFKFPFIKKVITRYMSYSYRLLLFAYGCTLIKAFLYHLWAQKLVTYDVL